MSKIITQTELNERLDLHLKWRCNEEGGVRLDLLGTDLSGQNLSGVNLSYANLSYANLSGVNLNDANLSGANLSGASMSGSNLRCAILRYANLSGASLSGASLRYANLNSVQGIQYVTVGWSAHGAFGRTLNCVRIDGVPMFFCGRFRGTEQEIRQYIADGNEQYQQSRTIAVDFCMARMKEMEGEV